MKRTTVKKPSFKRLFFKRLIIGILIAAAIGYLAYIAASILYENYMTEKSEDLYNKAKQQVESCYLDYRNCIGEDDAYDQFITTSIYQLSFYRTIDEQDEYPNVAFRIFDKDGKVIGDSHLQPYMYYFTVDEQTEFWSSVKYYFCHPDVAEDVHAKFAELDKTIPEPSDDEAEYKAVTCTKAYTDGKYFYPRLSICVMDASYHIVKVEESYDFFPEDTSGMQELVFTDSSPLTFVDHSEYCEPEAEKTLDRYLEDHSYENVNIGWRYEDIIINSRDITQVNPQDESEHFYLFCAVQFSLFDDYKLIFIISISALAFLAVCIPLFSSLLTYKDRKAQYDIFTARQQTTNAMAHDLKTPLTSISGYAEMLQNGVNPEKHQHYLEMISKNVEQMNSIVSDILKLAKSESAAIILNTEQLSVEDICNEVIKELRGTFETQKLSSELNVRKNATIKADRKLFTQALSNLLHNAAVYSKPETAVKVSLTDKSLCIVNTPGHMPKLSADELVKPFIKDDTFRGENSGSGVGLAIAKQDLERMGFELKIEIKDNEFRAVIKFR